ncbi:hypothetical protein D3C81_96400 [compost metagenome]
MKRLNKTALKIENNVLSDLDIEEIFDGLKIDTQLSNQYPGQPQTMESPEQHPGYYVGFNATFMFKEALTEEEKQIVISSLQNNEHSKEQAAEILQNLGPVDKEGNKIVVDSKDVEVDPEFEGENLKLYISVEK